MAINCSFPHLSLTSPPHPSPDPLPPTTQPLLNPHLLSPPMIPSPSIHTSIPPPYHNIHDAHVLPLVSPNPSQLDLTSTDLPPPSPPRPSHPLPPPPPAFTLPPPSPLPLPPSQSDPSLSPIPFLPTPHSTPIPSLPTSSIFLPPPRYSTRSTSGISVPRIRHLDDGYSTLLTALPQSLPPHHNTPKAASFVDFISPALPPSVQSPSVLSIGHAIPSPLITPNVTPLKQTSELLYLSTVEFSCLE